VKQMLKDYEGTLLDLALQENCVRYNKKVFDRTRLQLNNLVVMDMIFSYNFIRLIVLH
jgi:hypothetical protein